MYSPHGLNQSIIIMYHKQLFEHANSLSIEDLKTEITRYETYESKRTNENKKGLLQIFLNDLLGRNIPLYDPNQYQVNKRVLNQKSLQI